MTVPTNSHSLRAFWSHLFHPSIPFYFSSLSEFHQGLEDWIWNLMRGPDTGFSCLFGAFFFFFWTRRKTWNRSRNKASMCPSMWYVSNSFHASPPPSLPPPCFLSPPSFVWIYFLFLSFPLVHFCSLTSGAVLQRWCHRLSLVVPRPPPKRRKSNIFDQNPALRLQSTFGSLTVFTYLPRMPAVAIINLD